MLRKQTEGAQCHASVCMGLPPAARLCPASAQPPKLILGGHLTFWSSPHGEPFGQGHRGQAAEGERDSTWPRSRVTLTSLYSSPRDSGGLCHQRSVPSTALLTGCALLLLAAVQMSQYWPCRGGGGQMDKKGWDSLPLWSPSHPITLAAPPICGPLCANHSFTWQVHTESKYGSQLGIRFI